MRPGPLAYAAVIYVTATVSVVALWTFELGQPDGFAEFVLSNWFFWLMLSLLVFLPIRPPVHDHNFPKVVAGVGAAVARSRPQLPKVVAGGSGRRQVAVTT